MSDQTASVSALSEFFHGSEAKFGIFYPTGYMLAAFPDLARAQRAARELETMGFSRENILAAPGEDVVLLAEEELRRGGLWGLLMQELSRFIATEEVYADHDLKLAKAGAGFLVVKCPTEESKQKAWEIISRFDPIVARHYALDGIEHFKGEL